ncbi:hypothetical protein [Streptomyces sp. KR80]
MNIEEIDLDSLSIEDFELEAVSVDDKAIVASGPGWCCTGCAGAPQLSS